MPAGRPRSRAWADLPRLLAAVTGGEPYRRIAARYAISPRTVATIAKANGVSRPLGRPRLPHAAEVALLFRKGFRAHEARALLAAADRRLATGHGA
jgi:hypothetical protein